MKRKSLLLVVFGILCAALAKPATAEIVYTPVNVVIPISSSYNIDLNHDGTTDFTIRSAIGLIWCNLGDGGFWSLTVTPAQNNSVGVTTGQNAAALPVGVGVDSTQPFYNGTAVMAYLAYGTCGNFVLGNWFNVPYRYLGLQFQEVQANGALVTHYGWAKVTDIVYFDSHHNLQASTTLVGFAYETSHGKTILTGQTSDAADDQASTSPGP